MAEIKKSEIAEKDLLSGFIEDVNKGLKKLNEFNKGLEDTLKIQGELIKQGKKDTTSKGLKKQATEFKKVDKAVKTLSDSRKITIQLDKDKEKALLKLKKLNTDRVQQTVQLNRLSKEQNAINKDTEIINNKSVGTLTKLAAVNRTLIREQKDLTLETKKGRDRLKVINKELDKNTAFIKKNSSAMQKQSQNVGNYTDSIKEAAGASGLFGGILGKLNAVQATLGALTKKNVVVEEADVAAKTAQAGATANLTVAQRGLTLATSGGVKALKAFKIAMASSGIGALLLGVGALIAFFKRSQEGADSLSNGIAGLGAGLDVLLDRLQMVGEGMIKIWGGIGDAIKGAGIKAQIFLLEMSQFSLFGKVVIDNTDKIKELKEELGNLGSISEGVDLIKQAFKGVGDELEREMDIATRLNDLLIQLTRQQKLFEAEQAHGLRLAKEEELISKDKLKTDDERLAALTKANAIHIRLGEKLLDLQDQELAGAFESISKQGDKLKLTEEEIAFVEKLKNGELEVAEAAQMARDFTLGRSDAEAALFGIIDKIVAQENAQLALLNKRVKNTKQYSALLVQIATKNAMALVREAAAFREQAKDTKLSIEDRIELLRKAAVKEIESFKIQGKANIKNAKEVAAAKLQIEAKLQAAIKKLLPDYEALARKQVDLVNKIEQELLQNDIDRLQRRLEVEELNADEKLRILDEIFETEKTKARAQAKFLLTNDKLTAEERELIAIQLGKALEDIENNRADAAKKANEDRVAAAKKANEDIIKSEKQLQLERQQIADERIQSAKNVADILSELGKDNEGLQESLKAAKKLIAITEILINTERAVSAINADETTTDATKASKIFATRTGAALSLVKIAAFEKGGLVEGKEQTIKINEKGQEFVIDAPTTKALGLDKKGSSMDSFHQRFDSGLLSPHSFKRLEAGNIMQPNEIDFKKMINVQEASTKAITKSIRDNRSLFNMYKNNKGEDITEETRGGVTSRIIYKQDRQRF